MLEYDKRYVNNHIDEKRVQELKRARQERIEKQREKQPEEQKEFKEDISIRKELEELLK